VTQLNRREFIKTALAASTGFAALGRVTAVADADAIPKRPNLLFVFPDEMRAQAIACMGQDPVITPNLDRLASEGVVFTSAVSNWPVCSPYRAMLFAGKYSFSNGVLTNCNSSAVSTNSFLRPDERCLSDVLHDAGYNLGYIGKWHLDRPHEPYVEPPRGDGFVWDEYTPPEGRHGFDFWHSYGCYDGHVTPHYWTTDAKREEPQTFRQWSPEHEADVAIDYIRNRDGKCRDPKKPFALFVANNPPHMPFHLAPERYVQMYGDKTARDLLTRPNVDLSLDEGPTAVAKQWAKHYFAAVTGVDEQFGRILQCLKQEGLEDDTIVVFTSDHGEMMGSHNLMYKAQWYDEALLVPFIVRWPGKIKPGRDDLLLSVPDVMPSLLGLMGIADRIPQSVQGTDYSGVMLGKPAARPDSALYLHISPLAPQQGRRGLRTPRYTFVVRRAAGGQQFILHDNQKDPYQLKNIAGENAALVQELIKELNRWLARTGDPWAPV
jgi:arylsulfatase A-like enzyme